MSTLGIINSDPEVKKMVEFAFQEAPDHNYNLLFLVQEEEIFEFLNYALPELIVINFSDPNINIAGIVNYITNDKWILNLGIIGLYSQETDKEEELLKKYKAINVLAQLDNFRIRAQLVKSVQVIEDNYQIIFQREFSKNLLEGASGSFVIENDFSVVPLFSCIGATIIAQKGLINPDSKMHVQLALAELIVNAIEHGNCGITYEEKKEALSKGLSIKDIIAEKCKDPKIMAKRVTFNWEIRKNETFFCIIDEGKGFDVKAHIEKVKNQDKYSFHGRGLKIAAGFSHKLRYNAKGNQVGLIVKHDTSIEHEVPVGFSREQIVVVKKGDIVIKEGEPSDYLYYIASGHYEVLHNGKQVGSLSPQDIFMGEMSFLLNQRRSATIRAASAGNLIHLPQKNFINVIRKYPHYGIFLSKLLAKRLVRSNQKAAIALD